MKKIKAYYNQHPLTVILSVAIFVRLLAAFFSKGYAFHDDHFDVIRVAQNWAYGLPHWIESNVPPKHSMIYPAFNAIFIWVLDSLGWHDPLVKTTLLRVIHAFYSLLVVFLGFKITELISTRKNAIQIAWILSLLWFMPFLSVKFLAELVCVPPVLYAFYLVLRSDRLSGQGLPNFILAGLLFGLAFSVRMHTVLFAGGMGLVLLFERKWMQSVLFTVAFLVTIFVVIGIPDILFFEYPFQYVVNYFAHNSENAYNYITGSPFKFLLTTFGFLVPPISLMILWGYIKSWKVDPKMFLAVLIFFIVHSAFPNKQERFILPMYPFLIILGIIGWNSFKEGSRFWVKYPKLLRGSWQFFWVLNIIATLVLALTYSKKDRVAPIHYLAEKKDLSSLIVESERGTVKQVPVYYLGRLAADYSDFQKGNILGMNRLKTEGEYQADNFPFVFALGADKDIEELQEEFSSVNKIPNYVIFKGNKDLEKRKLRVINIFPGKVLTLQKVIDPSFFDKLLFKLNPRRHRDEVAHIYKIE